MLKQRIISAIIMAIVVVGTIFFLDTRYVSVLFAFIMLVSMLELVNLTISRNKMTQWVIACITVGLFFVLLPELGTGVINFYSYLGLFLWLVIILILFNYRFSGDWSHAIRISVLLFSTLLIWICVNGLVFIHQHFAQGAWILMYVLTLVWVADIGAYFSGKALGKNKLAPAISPGKTREGVLGGLLLNAVWISLVFWLSDGWGLDYLPFLFLGLVTAAISVVGDLFESILKREAGMKDSGKLLPGHGGVLDRIDSVIAATPVYLSGLFLLGAV